jgi:hypothetical protein
LKIWLDDERNPEDFGANGYYWAKSYDRATTLLAAGVVDEISLDHDLGEGKDGYDVASFIEKGVMEEKFRMPVWHIHSANPVGRNRIEMAMKSAEKLQKKVDLAKHR